MCFFRNKRAKQILQKTEDHNELIQSSLKKIKMLTVKLEEKPEICNAIVEIYNKYGNVSANGRDATIALDKKILSLLGQIDARAEESHSSGNYSEIEKSIKEIRIIIAER